jgi:hypothetical protein
MRALISGTIALALLASGCASTGRRHGYPTQEELQALAAADKPRNVFSAEVLDVAHWDFEEPFAERIELQPVRASGPFAAVLEAQLARSAGTLIATAPMDCAAHEIGRFYLEHRALPSETLRASILAHCGVVTADVRHGSLRGEVAAKISEAMLVRDWSSSASDLLHSLRSSAPSTIGLWFGRSQTDAVLVAVAGELRADIEPFSTTVDEDGRVVIRGRLRSPAERVFALINHGRYGFETCIDDSRVALPDFAIACSMQPGDALARLSIGAVPPDRLLGHGLLDVLVRSTPDAGKRYQEERYVSGMTAADDDAFQVGALDLVNQVRRQAGLESVALAERESATARELAPHFFAAALRGDPEHETDVIALGLVAGWEVQEIVRRGWFAGTWVGPTDDIGRWLAAVLSRPGGRQVLLDPEARKLAIGPLVYHEPPVLSALLTAYALFPTDREASDAQRVLDKIRRERELRGLAEPQKLRGLGNEVTAHAALIRQQGYSPMGALQDLLQVSVDVLNRSVRGLVIETYDLEEFRLPDELFRRDLELDLAVTHYQPDDHPWGRYAVLVLIAGPKSIARADITPAAGPAGAGAPQR